MNFIYLLPTFNKCQYFATLISSITDHTAMRGWGKQLKMQDFWVPYSAVSLIQSVQDGTQKWDFFFNEIMSLESTWWHRDYHTKWSQKQKDTIWHHLYLEYKTGHKWTYLWNRNRLTDIENRLVVSKGESGRGKKDWEFEISRCRLLYIGWINNKDLLYSTGNYSISCHKP